MNLRKLFIPMCVALAFASCQDGKNGNGEPEEGVPTSVTVTIEVGDQSAPGASGRAVSFPESTPTQEEMKVNNITIFVFNNQQMLERIETQDYKALGGSTQKVFSFDITVTSGRHYFLAVANVPTSHFDFQTEGTLMENLCKEILDFDVNVLTGEDLSYVDLTRGFLMTNKSGPAEAYLSEDNQQNKVTIEIGRAVSKVSLGFDPTVDGQPNGRLENIEYLVTNNPATMYLMPTYSGYALITPNYYDKTVEDGHYQSPRDNYQGVITSSTLAEDKTFTYCMENSNFTPKEGNTTMLLIKGVYTPNAWLTATGGAGTATGDNTFWRIANLKDNGAVAYYEAGYYAEEPAASLMNQDPTNLYTQAAVKYEKGLCYYPLWLKNDNSGNDNKYTVKRNSYYKVTITSVADAGSHLPDGGIDPEEPLDKQVTISASIVVSNWDDIDYEVGL